MQPGSQPMQSWAVALPTRERAPSCPVGSNRRAQGQPLPLPFHAKALLGVGKVGNQGIPENLGGKEHTSQPGTLSTTQDPQLLVGTSQGLGAHVCVPHITVQLCQTLLWVLGGCGNSTMSSLCTEWPDTGSLQALGHQGSLLCSSPLSSGESPGSQPGWHLPQPDTSCCHVTPLSSLTVHTRWWLCWPCKGLCGRSTWAPLRLRFLTRLCLNILGHPWSCGHWAPRGTPARTPFHHLWCPAHSEPV